MTRTRRLITARPQRSSRVLYSLKIFASRAQNCHVPI
ncbi:Protein of unknown function [Pyronema omphalodes CBS 100304]|uniref:Uncharacterized protein n=1 Tax=Pyronema omphalodes (strain CBS 100304) TaxID=1076935 RepID=U4LPV5_PYROM|nr:Protein of unknown function [Pyronema omphalodes CBS 100304]